MNKNISVWRGNDTPPTNYHLWIKDDKSINVYDKNEWKVTSYPELKDDLTQYIYEQIEALKEGANIDFDTLKEISDWIKKHEEDYTTTFPQMYNRLVAVEKLASSNKDSKQDKQEGKGLSSNDFTDLEKIKLSGIAEGANVNVQSDWNATEGDAFIKNKPTKVSQLENDSGYLTEHQDISNKVDRDDYAPKLTAGFANNLVGRGEATPEVISFRSSGGDTSIEDGTARIERIKGDTVVWNQFAPTDLSTYILLRGTNETYVDGVFTATANTANSSSYIYKYASEIVPSRLGRIIYGVAEIKAESTNAEIYIIGVGTKCVSATGDWQKIETFGKVSVWSGAVIGAGVRVKDELVTWSIRKLKYYDLTQMFGEGNEPTTIEEFHARKPLNIDEYAYNEGELISNNAEELKSVGFNAWDEEWELGSFFNGEKVETTSTWRNKNDIAVVPNKQYRFEIESPIYINAFDRYGNYLYAQRIAESGSKTFDKNEHHIWVRPYDDVTTYNHDICIHLVHTGYRNGEYEPYKEFRRSIPIKDIKDNDGNQLFPNGLLSAGSVYDEITATKAIKRVGVVDMGTLSWNYQPDPSTARFYNNTLDGVNTTPTVKGNAVCAKYTTEAFNTLYNHSVDRCIAITSAGKVQVYDSSYTDADTFKAAMSGVMLYYELAEPVEVDLPEPLNFDYEAWDFGTEEIVSSEPTTPMKADIIYQFNAVDRIRDNSRHTAESVELLNAKADKTYVDEVIRISVINVINSDL